MPSVYIGANTKVIGGYSAPIRNFYRKPLPRILPITGGKKLKYYKRRRRYY